MRIIDADALMESFENVLGAALCELNGYEIWEVLNAQECIAAIPVEWLNHIQTECVCDMVQVPMYVAIGWLVDMWQKEQEARM